MYDHIRSAWPYWRQTVEANQTRHIVALTCDHGPGCALCVSVLGATIYHERCQDSVRSDRLASLRCIPDCVLPPSPLILNSQLKAHDHPCPCPFKILRLRGQGAPPPWRPPFRLESTRSRPGRSPPHVERWDRRKQTHSRTQATFDHWADALRPCRNLRSEVDCDCARRRARGRCGVGNGAVHRVLPEGQGHHHPHGTEHLWALLRVQVRTRSALTWPRTLCPARSALLLSCNYYSLVLLQTPSHRLHPARRAAIRFSNTTPSGSTPRRCRRRAAAAPGGSEGRSSSASLRLRGRDTTASTPSSLLETFTYRRASLSTFMQGAEVSPLNERMLDLLSRTDSLHPAGGSAVTGARRGARSCSSTTTAARASSCTTRTRSSSKTRSQGHARMYFTLRGPCVHAVLCSCTPISDHASPPSAPTTAAAPSPIRRGSTSLSLWPSLCSATPRWGISRATRTATCPRFCSGASQWC